MKMLMPLQRLARIAEIIEHTDQRAAAADGPVTPTRLEMTDEDFREIYRLAREQPKRKVRAVHVVPDRANRCWIVRRAGAENITGHISGFAPTKAEAVKNARALAMRVHAELIVHNRNGRIAWRNSYGNDPRNRKG